jgi:hypothetical protein
MAGASPTQWSATSGVAARMGPAARSAASATAACREGIILIMLSPNVVEGKNRK